MNCGRKKKPVQTTLGVVCTYVLLICICYDQDLAPKIIVGKEAIKFQIYCTCVNVMEVDLSV